MSDGKAFTGPGWAWVGSDPANGLIGYWINTEDTGLYIAPKPTAAPERPAPAGWDTLENVR